MSTNQPSLHPCLRTKVVHCQAHSSKHKRGDTLLPVHVARFCSSNAVHPEEKGNPGKKFILAPQSQETEHEREQSHVVGRELVWFRFGPFVLDDTLPGPRPATGPRHCFYDSILATYSKPCHFGARRLHHLATLLVCSRAAKLEAAPASRRC